MYTKRYINNKTLFMKNQDILPVSLYFADKYLKISKIYYNQADDQYDHDIKDLSNLAIIA